MTLAGLAVMKIVSWNDGYPNRRKDASDLALIMGHYTDAGNAERIFNEHSDLLESEDFDYVTAGARLLGRDIGAILSSDLKDRVMELLDKETGKQARYKLIEDMLMSKTLIEANIRALGVNILAIVRGERTIPNPPADSKILLGDELICFGKLENIRNKICEGI